MALSADERTHVLVGLLGDIFTSASEGFEESGTSRLEVHGASVMTVGATDGIHDLASPLAPRSLVELCDPLLPHDTRYVWALTRPAGTGLYVLITVHTRGARAKDLIHIFDGVLVPTWSIVLHGEGIACPKDDHLRSCCEYVDTL